MEMESRWISLTCMMMNHREFLLVQMKRPISSVCLFVEIEHLIIRNKKKKGWLVKQRIRSKFRNGLLKFQKL